MIVDYHMHLRDPDERVVHRPETVEPYVERAVARGLDEIGFTEHVYYFAQTSSLWSVPYHVERCRYDIEDYVEAVVEAKRRGLPVKLGLEVDFQPDRAEETAQLLAPYPWDYLLGSIHFIDGLALDQEPSLVGERGWELAWETYFAWLLEAASSGVVDVLAHPDLVRFFGNDSAPPSAADDYARVCAAAAEAGVCLEVSAAGLRKPVGEVYPAPEFLETARQSGVAITTASDAHVPQDVGRNLERAVAHARAAGYETVTLFDARRPRQEPLG